MAVEMERHSNGSTGSSGSLVMEANYGGAATAITCTYFLVQQEDDHYPPISSGSKDEEPLFNMTLAAVCLVNMQSTAGTRTGPRTIDPSRPFLRFLVSVATLFHTSIV